MRALMSLLPPGVNGTTIRILSGNFVSLECAAGVIMVVVKARADMPKYDVKVAVTL